MILANSGAETLLNIILSIPVIIGLIVFLIIVLLIGIYIECRRTSEMMKANNAIKMQELKQIEENKELLKEIKYIKSYQSKSKDKDK